jgi:hypothetical protein
VTSAYFKEEGVCKNTCPGFGYEKTVENDIIYCKKAETALAAFTAPATPESKSFVSMPSSVGKILANLNIPLPGSLSSVAESGGKAPTAIGFGMSPPAMFKSKKSKTSRLLQETETEEDDEPDHFVFIAKFFDQSLTLIVIVFATFVFFVFEEICRTNSWKFATTLFTNLRYLTGWNLVLILIGTDVEDIIFYASLEYRNLYNDTAMARVSFAESLIALLTVLGFFIGGLYVVWKAQAAQKSKDQKVRPNFRINFQGYQVFHWGNKREDLQQHSFYLIYIGKRAFSAIIGASMFNAPMAQSIIQVLINVAILGYILYKRPLKKLINTIHIVIMEILLLLTNIFVLIIVKLALDGKIESDSAASVADVIIELSVASNVVLLVFLGVKLLLEGVNIYKFVKETKDASYLVWLQLLTVVFNVAGMGIEDFRIPEYNVATKEERANMYIKETTKAAKEIPADLYTEQPIQGGAVTERVEMKGQNEKGIELPDLQLVTEDAVEDERKPELKTAHAWSHWAQHESPQKLNQSMTSSKLNGSPNRLDNSPNPFLQGGLDSTKNLIGQDRSLFRSPVVVSDKKNI